uniref:Uncharacterized protein n=1 Tax=Ditylenchus dipsaci TaxID=166011 RepID=A0A915E4Z6_9BILA
MDHHQQKRIATRIPGKGRREKKRKTAYNSKTTYPIASDQNESRKLLPPCLHHLWISPLQQLGSPAAVEEHKWHS